MDSSGPGYTLGESITQVQSDGTTISGDVHSWNDSGNELGLIHVGADDGLLFCLQKISTRMRGFSRPGGRARGGCRASGPIRKFTRAFAARTRGRVDVTTRGYCGDPNDRVNDDSDRVVGTPTVRVVGTPAG